MIRPLRQRHRRTFAVIGVLLPITFAVGIAARKPAPTVTTLPTALATTARHFEAVEWERADLFAKTPIQVRLLRERAGAGHSAVGLSAPKDFVKPDLIVYWVVDSPNITDSLPDNAWLLGAFNSSALPLPQEATQSDGVLVLYSLADQEIVEVSKPFRLLATKTERGSVTRSNLVEHKSNESSSPSPQQQALRLAEPRSEK